jgi:hypothetical protein
MSLTQLPPTASNIQSQSALITIPESTGGTGPYKHNLYRSTVTGFTPAAGNEVATLLAVGTLTFQDTGLIPNTVYYYVAEAVDTGNGNATQQSTQFTMASTLSQQLSQNVAAPTEIAGTVDQQFSANSFEGVIDAGFGGTAYPGQAVKIVNTNTPFPTFTPCTANNDPVWGFINYDYIKPSYVAGDRISVSRGGNVIRLFATQTIAKGAEVMLDITAVAAVQNVVGAGGSGSASLVGEAYDQMANNGIPARVFLRCPSIPLVTG